MASIGDYDYAIGSLHILSEDEVRDYPRLEAERLRALHRRLELEDKKRIAERAITRIDERLERINQALTLLPVDLKVPQKPRWSLWIVIPNPPQKITRARHPQPQPLLHRLRGTVLRLSPVKR